MKPIEVKLDKPRKFRFDSNALIDVEVELNKPFGEVIKPFFEAAANQHSTDHVYAALNISTLRALLWAALRWEDPNLTVRAAGDLMEESMSNNEWADVQAKLMGALQGSGFFTQILDTKSKTSKSGPDETSSPSTTAVSGESGFEPPPTK